MAKMKKLLAATLASAMAVSMLFGCGGNEKNVETTTESTTQATEATETESTAATETVTEATEEPKEENNVNTGDVLIDLTFDDDSVGGCATYMNGGDCELSATGGELVLDVKKSGNLNYANQVYYDGFALNQDCVYELSFDVRSTVERGLEYRIQINGGDYHAYVMDEITVGAETMHVSKEFTMQEESDPAPRLCMNLGHFDYGEDGTPHQVYFDNVKLTVVDASKAMTIEALPEAMKVNINQLGYKPDSKKLATITEEAATSFDVLDVKTGKSVLQGTIGDRKYDSGADDKFAIVDFSQVKAEGTYKIVLDTGSESFEFPIGNDVYGDVYRDSVLMLYSQRCGSALDGSICGDFAHEACHMGTAIVYGSDMAIDVSGGWHDAGDYGRYVVPGAKTVQDLLLTYEESQAAASDDSVGIPESGNGVADILDEARYELEFLFKMQEPITGGVYHKVTGEVFPETVLAVDETAQLYISPISNTATGDFAAVMAKASIVYKDIDAEFAAKCLEAAKKAYAYIDSHIDDGTFSNPGSIVTGEYPDSRDEDELLWAACELYLATGDEAYNTRFKEVISMPNVKYGLGWQSVGYYAVYDYCMNVASCDAEKNILKEAADKLVENYNKSAYGSTTGGSYSWGSNMTVADNGVLLVMAAKVLGDNTYMDYAQDQLNFLLGRNAVSYCYITGYGSRTPEHPHHRPSEVIGKAVPGMLVGGANQNLEDPYAKAVLNGKAPEKCYVDNAQSFSCNEITIYWNSPFIHLLANFR